MSLKYCACHEKVMPGHTKRCTCHTKLSSQTEGLKFDFLHFLQTGNPRLNKQQIIIQQPKKWFGMAVVLLRFLFVTYCVIFGLAVRSLGYCLERSLWCCVRSPGLAFRLFYPFHIVPLLFQQTSGCKSWFGWWEMVEIN
jgi:hypothetical protein